MARRIPENETKHRDRHILELKRELDEAQTLIAEMREQVLDCNDVIDRWVEAFDMALGDNGTYSFAPWTAEMESHGDKYNAPRGQIEPFCAEVQRRRGAEGHRSPACCKRSSATPSDGHAKVRQIVVRHRCRYWAWHGSHRCRQG
jgi:hypothetical protein